MIFPFFTDPDPRIHILTFRLAEPENLKTVPVLVPTFYLITVPVLALVPAPVPGHIHT